MSSVLSAKHFHDEKAAFAFVEARVWAGGRVCPHCGVVDGSGPLKGKSTRLGVYKCYACRKPFTVKVGTVFESSHIPLHVWLQAMALMSSSKKGISSNQLHRILGVGLKAAWFLSHRIREAMRDGSLSPMGGDGGPVEIDETYFGRMETPRPSPQRRGRPPLKRKRDFDKRAIISLVERGGSVRSFRGSPRTGKKKPKEKAQRERFIEAAREHGVTKEGFERLFRQVVPPKPRP